MTGKEDGIMYNVHSAKAEEFINHQEILDTIAWAEENKNNKEAVEALIERARDCKGLTHRRQRFFLHVRIRNLWTKCMRQQRKSKRNFTETAL